MRLMMSNQLQVAGLSSRISNKTLSKNREAENRAILFGDGHDEGEEGSAKVTKKYAPKINAALK
jgi:hypothetical protein